MCKYCIALQNPSGSRALGEKGKFWPVGETLGIQFMGGTEEQKIKEQELKYIRK